MYGQRALCPNCGGADAADFRLALGDCGVDSSHQPALESLLLRPLDRPPDVRVRVPGSKSITNRALLCAALSPGHSRLTGALFAEDTRAMLAIVSVSAPEVSITSVGSLTSRYQHLGVEHTHQERTGWRPVKLASFRIASKVTISTSENAAGASSRSRNSA